MVKRLIDILGLEKITLLDVGSRWGIHKRWSALGKKLQVIGFEPDAEECQRLNQKQSGNIKNYPLALSNKAGREILHIAREAGRSSLFLPNLKLLKRYPDHEGFEVVDRREVPTDTLDHFLEQQGISDIDFIKLDVQGGEKRILEGAANTLKNRVSGLEIEVEFSPLYQDQPLFSDIDNLCRKAGLVLFDLKPCYWKRTSKPIRGIGQLTCGDALYLRDFVQTGFVPDPEQAGAALVICLIYQKYDYALELLDYFCTQRIYSSSIYQEAQKQLVRLSHLTFPLNLPFKGRYHIAKWLERASQNLMSLYWARWEDWKI